MSEAPSTLLHDLESIRQLLEADLQEPPVLSDALDAVSIPLLSDIVSPPPVVASAPILEPLRVSPAVGQIHSQVLQQLDSRLQGAAQLLAADLVKEFLPQIEAELLRRLSQLLPKG